MNLKEIVAEDDDKVKIDTRNTLSTEDSSSITDIIKEKFGDSPFTLNDLARIADSESAVRYLKDHIGTRVKENKDGEDRVAYNLNEDELPESSPENAEVEDTQRIRKITGDKFALKPAKKPVVGKEEALKIAIKNINNTIGVGSVIFGDNDIPKIKKLSSGCYSLDKALGGGWAKGLIV